MTDEEAEQLLERLQQTEPAVVLGEIRRLVSENRRQREALAAYVATYEPEPDQDVPGETPTQRKRRVNWGVVLLPVAVGAGIVKWVRHHPQEVVLASGIAATITAGGFALPHIDPPAADTTPPVAAPSPSTTLTGPRVHEASPSAEQGQPSGGYPIVIETRPEQTPLTTPQPETAAPIPDETDEPEPQPTPSSGNTEAPPETDEPPGNNTPPPDKDQPSDDTEPPGDDHKEPPDDNEDDQPDGGDDSDDKEEPTDGHDRDCLIEINPLLCIL